MGGKMTDKEWVTSMLKSHMRRYDITMAVLAERSGIDKSTVSNVVRGKSALPYETLKALHRGTGIPYDAFFREGKWSAWR